MHERESTTTTHAHKLIECGISGIWIASKIRTKNMHRERYT